MENFPIINYFLMPKDFKGIRKKTNANSCEHKIKLNLMRNELK